MTSVWILPFFHSIQHLSFIVAMFRVRSSYRTLMQCVASASTSTCTARTLSTTAAVAMPRKRIAQIESDYDIENLDEFQFDDHTTFGHHFLHQVREVRGYLRRVRYELPGLKGK
jgi:hypothetical protein